jgi:hypothetical protein
MWNILDLIPPLFIIAIIIVDCIPGKNLIEDDDAAETPIDDVVEMDVSEFFQFTTFLYFMQSFACILMWFKFCYFLRIYRSTGFFVNMLVRITIEVKTFSLILLIILAAFGCTFKILGVVGGNMTGGFMQSLFYAYLLALGEFQMDDFDDLNTSLLVYFFFIIASVILLIVMLNILIALVSTVYDNIIEEQEPANDYERIVLISEILGLINVYDKRRVSKEDEFLLVARSLKHSN